MGNTLKSKIGPLPVWGYAVIGFLALVYYLYRKNQKAQAAAQAQANGVSSTTNAQNTSNMTAQAQPMPIQLGDTFINNTPSGGTTTSQTGNCTTTSQGGVCPPQTSADSLQPASVPAGPTVTTPQTQAA